MATAERTKLLLYLEFPRFFPWVNSHQTMIQLTSTTYPCLSSYISLLHPSSSSSSSSLSFFHIFFRLHPSGLPSSPLHPPYFVPSSFQLLTIPYSTARGSLPGLELNKHTLFYSVTPSRALSLFKCPLPAHTWALDHHHGAQGLSPR